MIFILLWAELILLVLLVLAAMAYVRFTPGNAGSAVAPPNAAQPGDYPAEGGFYAVRALHDLPGDVLAQLEHRISAEPRVARLSGGPDNLAMVYETRSRIWAFPDINTIWVKDGNLHLHAHLVYGRKDFGANQRRVLGWLQGL